MPADEASKRLLARAAARGRTEADFDQEREKRQRQTAAAVLEHTLGRRYARDRASLDRFQVYHPDQRKCLDRLRRLAEGLDRLTADGCGVVLYGSVGTGKDHLLAALLYAAVLRFGLNCSWRNGQDLYGLMRDRIDAGLKEEEILQELAAPQILALSDPVPPSGELSNWRLELLYRLVNRRYHALKPTWLTLNALTTADAEGKLSSQVWDRLQESAELVPCFWPSFRERRGQA